MNVDAALTAYDLKPPVEIFVLPDAGGINNRIRGVRTGAGRYVWKTYLTHQDPAVIRYEHRLLMWLAAQSLPFGTPLPISTRTGDTLSPIPDGAGWQALFTHLPGDRLDTSDPALIEALGAALGQLHGALSCYPLDRRPGFDDYAALNRIHPAVPDPYALTPADLQIAPTVANAALLAWWRETLGSLRGFIDGPYRTLLRQVIHGDFGPGNTFVTDGQIAAVYDFEFAAPNVRALDVASGLAFVMRIWERDTPTALMMARRFRIGYARQIDLTAAEIAALPDLMLLRDAAAAIWWAGRGITAGDAPPPVSRIATVRAAVRWMGEHNAAFFNAVR